MDEDSQLVESFKRGNQKSFEHLVRKYKTTVFNTVYSMLGNTAEAEDTTQEIFLKVYSSLGSFKSKSSFSTYLYRITVNKCLDKLKKRKNQPISLENELNEEEQLRLKDIFSSDEKNIEDEIDRKELQETIRKILNSLPEKYRLVLTLKEIEGLSYKEMARIMKISVNKVKVWLFRARAKLKTKLLATETTQNHGNHGGPADGGGIRLR